MTEYEKKCCGGDFTYDDSNDERHEEYQQQIEKYGFAEYEIWDLDVTIISFILPRLTLFRESLHGYCDTEFSSQEEWDAVLDKIIAGFKLYLATPTTPLDKMTSDREQIISDAFDLFRDNFTHLWN